eukprot:3793822-Pyramimonas_sp.AAC.1
MRASSGSRGTMGLSRLSPLIGAFCTILAVTLLSSRAAAIEITEPEALKGYYTHYRVESAAALSADKLVGDVFVPTELLDGSNLPGGIMIINRQHYGVDPQYGVDANDVRVNWVDRVKDLEVKAILLEEYEGNMLYRRWDPYTVFDIPVLQQSSVTAIPHRRQPLYDEHMLPSITFKCERCEVWDVSALRLRLTHCPPPTQISYETGQAIRAQMLSGQIVSVSLFTAPIVESEYASLQVGPLIVKIRGHFFATAPIDD